MVVTVAVKLTGVPCLDCVWLDVRAVAVVAAVTVPVAGVEATLTVVVLPEYTATMLLLPNGRAVVANVAVPLASVALPSRTPPAKKLTVPVVAAPAPMTALSVTGEASVELAGTGAKLVMLSAPRTAALATADDAAVLLASPAYWARKLAAPAGTLTPLSVAMPPMALALPMAVLPL